MNIRGTEVFLVHRSIIDIGAAPNHYGLLRLKRIVLENELFEVALVIRKSPSTQIDWGVGIIIQFYIVGAVIGVIIVSCGYIFGTYFCDADRRSFFREKFAKKCQKA